MLVRLTSVFLPDLLTMLNTLAYAGDRLEQQLNLLNYLVELIAFYTKFTVLLVIGPSLFVKNQSSVVSIRFDLKRESFNKIQIKIDFRSHSSQRTDGLN